LGDPRQSAAPQGPQQALLRVREPIFEPRLTTPGPGALRAATAVRLALSLDRAAEYRAARAPFPFEQNVL
jgi:hypothetical protein